jgi:hypothetical protein
LLFSTVVMRLSLFDTNTGCTYERARHLCERARQLYERARQLYERARQLYERARQLYERARQLYLSYIYSRIRHN